jgi:O-antigen biosynthesis protein
MADAEAARQKLRSNYSKYAARNPLFRLDHDWLRAQDPYVALASGDDTRFDFQEYYLKQHEKGLLVSPNPLVDWRYYDRRTHYLARKGRTPIEYDYMTLGLEKNIPGHWIFTNQHFASLLSRPGEKPMTEEGLEQIRANYGSYYMAAMVNHQRYDRVSPIFSCAYYRRKIGRPTASHLEALRHYLAVGSKESVHGSPLFDEQWYMTRYGEGLSIGDEPHHTHRTAVEHFLTVGLKHGLSPIPDFDEEYYKKLYPYVEKDISKGVYSSAIDHFLGNLATEARPNPYFDPVYYLEQHPEARKEMVAWGLVHPLEHFLEAGYGRGWRASEPLISVAIPENYAKAAFERRQQMTAQQYLLSSNKANFDVDEPQLSLVIPVCGHFDFTASLLTQVWAQHRQNARRRAQVIVVDNGSHDRTTELPELFPGITYIRIEDPVGYTRACIAGAQQAKAPIIVFLNNDIELGVGALDALADELDENPDIGVTGPKIVLTDGLVQEAGGVVFANGGTAGFGRGMRPDSTVLNIARDVDSVSGCALAIRRRLYEQLGGLDEQFSPGYFEDTDLCLRAWEAGFRVRYLPDAYITHYEYATYSKGRPKEISAQRMYANKAKFVHKHRRLLEETGAPVSDPDVAAAAFRRGGFERNHVLFIEDLAPFGLFGSGFVRSEDVVREFLAKGWRVIAWAAARRPGDEQFRAKYEGAVELRSREEVELPDLLKAIGPALGLVWVCRTHNIANYRGALLDWRRKGPDRRLVADTEALASLRNAFPGLSPSEAAEQPKAAKVVQSELAAAQDFDAVVCVNGHEARLATLAAPEATVRMLGHRFEAAASPAPRDERSGFVFCGAVHEASSPNMDSLTWFCRRIWPLIAQRLPDAHFSFVGYVRDGVELPPEVTANARVVGRVDALEPVFAAHRIFVAPTRIAAGVPHKVQQAMALGLPCVITDNLADQLEPSSDLRPFFSSPVDAEAFAERCAELYTDAALWRRVQADALEEITRKASPAAFSQAFDEVLTAVGAHAFAAA